MKMKLVILAACLALAACQVPGGIYNNMSDEEIAAHNMSVEFWDQVYCVSEVRIGSHIRKRHCETLWEMQDGFNHGASQVNTLSFGSASIFQ